MTIDSPATLGLAVVAVIAATVALAYLWNGRRILGRALLVTLVVALIAAACAVQINRLTTTYPSWSSLVREPANGGSLSAGVERRPGGGRLTTVTVPGRASGLTLTMGVYLPAAYDLPGRRFPVIEVFHGFPGSPSTWIRRLDVVRHLDREIGAGRMAPTVVLFPYQTPRRLLDTECTNLAGGPQTETFLTEDVAAYATTHLRVRADRAAWGLIGYSAGGFCAMNLALRHPGRYAAAASLSGDSGPAITIGDGSEHTTNHVAWRLRHLPQPRVDLYVAWAADDTESRDGSRDVVRLARPPLRVTAVELPHGGHSPALWRRMEGPAFDWLSSRLARSVPDGS
ncbi:esterase [Actinoplanes sp. NBRC 14428]|uniref:S-formylglutathione hydrolase FrmB n=1 Tax=Pseudosporangium ferrugineum TaxID=439699 RepID=A0A2T0S6K6_9ACTN|nr:alpha/beta fold hydrolase [Pseudosporangium ferrugineum]PRY29047.1 S-formylglutathione hydrolase FrmB [Pseudosporangium ferrugineum]BCJ53486.1 esterase [Actinoplanes sp. NBRC 14428]